MQFFSVTEKLTAHSRAFGGVREHEVSELYMNPRDVGHFLNVLKKEVYKSKYAPGYITHLGDDPLSGSDIMMPSQMQTQAWFDYYFREEWLHRLMPHEAIMDPNASGYDPDYLHAHH